MNDIIEAVDVIERNDCAGKKSFFVTAQASDETISSLFSMHPAYMPPENKLALASVASMDRLRVNYARYSQNILYNGSYIVFDGNFFENLSDTRNRDPVCRCDTRMVSDGFDVHCPNLQCPLTLTARIERLGNTEFFDMESVLSDPELCRTGVIPSEATAYSHPFMFVTQGLFWGEPGGSVENILLRNRVDPPSIATFLVPPLFEDFLENPTIPSHMAQMAATGAERFYGWMNETINRRDPLSPTQNKLWSAFLWSLGIETLKPVFFENLFNFEYTVAMGDPAVVYASLLTKTRSLVEIGFHPVEASTLVNEVRKRAHELHDIFYHWAINKDDITRSFRHLT